MAERVIPEIDEELCTLCGDCVSACPRGALSISPQRGVRLDEETCSYCGDCEDVCPVGAIALPFEIVVITTDGRSEVDHGGSQHRQDR